jgi:hypothetical protein
MKKPEMTPILCILLAGCGGGGSDNNSDPAYSVGGTVSGLNGELVLQNGGSDSLSLSDNGTFSFPSTVTRGDGYSVTVLTQPTGQTCTVSSGSGTVNDSNITDVAVDCVLNSAGNFALTPTSIKTFRFTWSDVPGSIPTEYHLLEDPDGASGYTRIASIEPGAESHDLDVFLPGRINARYVLQTCNDDNCVDSAPVSVEGTLAEAVGYVKASNTGAFDEFGYSVALSADGSTMAVGAHRETSAATGINGDETDDSDGPKGAVYVFKRNGSAWSQNAYIKASNAGAEDEFSGDQFGRSLSISADGNTLAVGAHGEASNAVGINQQEDDNSIPQSGAVYVFTHNDDEWNQQAYLKASRAGPHWFGWSVALAADGNTLAVGAYAESNHATGVNGNQDNGIASSSGAVYVFTRSDDQWSQQAYIKASNTTAGSNEGGLFQALQFGHSVAIAGDGNTLAVGAVGDDSNATGVNGDENNDLARDSGAVYVFIRDNGVWNQQAYIKASNTGEDDRFGSSVALAVDGNTLAVGATEEDSNAIGVDGDQNNDLASDTGAVYVFSRADDTWSQQSYIKASNAGMSVLPGSSVDYGRNVVLSADGKLLAVSASGESSDATGVNDSASGSESIASGAVYLYARSNDAWNQQAHIKAPNRSPSNWFGQGIGIAADGSTLAIGAYGEDSEASGINGDQDQTGDLGVDSGAVYLY